MFRKLEHVRGQYVLRDLVCRQVKQVKREKARRQGKDGYQISDIGYRKSEDRRNKGERRHGALLKAASSG